MSATEDSSSNVEDENTRINPVGGSQDPEIRSEGNVLTLDSTNTKNNGDRLLNTSEPAILSLEGTNKDSGDATVQILSRESETSDKMESEDICNSDAGKGSGDYSAKAKLSDAIRQKVDNIDENKEVTLNTDVIAEKEDSNDGFLDKGDDVDLEKDNDEDQGDDLDDDITLRWDDDDGSSQPLGVDNENSETKNDEILDEEKLLEESSDVIIQESAAKSSDINLDRDNSNDEADGIVLSTDKNIKNITVEESVDSPKGDTHIETSDGKNIDNILEDELLEEPDPETEIHPEMDIPSKNAEEDINDLESELLEESNIEIDQDKEVPAEKSMDKDIEERIEDEISEINKISKDSTVKENLDSIEEDILLTESESNTEIEATVFTIKSFTDAILNPDSEDVALEDNLLTDSESNLESSEIIPETDFSVNKDLEDSEDALLEAKILEDIKKAEDMLENDIAMDVDDDTEGELLKGDESHDESSTPMDVDNTDQSIENSAKVQEEIDQPINDESELTKAGLESPLNQQTVKANLSKAITLDENATNNTEKDQLDDIQAISETNIDQACQEQAETELIEQQGETETTVKPIDEQPKADDNKKDQPIDDSNDMEQSSSTPVHIQTPIDSDKPKTQIDDVGKPLPEKENDNPKIEDEIKSENPEEIIETANLDQTTDISANNASICLEDSPVHIKIKHGLHKPDVMLEIPTQELKDMDDTELSFNLDQSEIIDGNNDVDTNADDIVYENAVSQEPIVTDTAVSQESMLTDTAVSQKAIVIDTSDNQEVKLTDTTGNQGAKVTDTTVSQDAKVTNIAVSQESAVTDTTVRQEVKLTDTAVSLEAAVTDTTVSQEPAVTDTTVSQEVKVTDATGRQEAKVTDIAVSQEAKVTDTAVSQEAAVTDAPGRQEAIETDTTVSQEAAVSDTTGRQEAKVTDTAVSQEVAVTDTAVRREAIVTETAVNEVEKDVVESTDDVKDKDAVVPETIEESMERMFADDEPAQELVEATKSQTQVPEEQPSTSFTTMTPDTSDEVPEVSDSLGLLAESSGRIMEDDEEPDDDDDGDDDDDFDQDESSNQISAEQSEDSNPPVLESETAEQQVEKEIETPDPKDDQFQFLVDSVDNSEDKADKMDIEEFGTVELQAESINDEETKTAVDALLRDGAPDEQEEEPEDNADQMDIETVKLSDTSDNEGETPTAVEETAVEPDKEEKQANQSPSKSNQSPSKTNQSPSKQSPSKMKKLEITTQEASSVVNYVDLEESSSEDDIQEVEKQPEEETAAEKPTSPESQDVTNVNIPTGIEIMCTSGGSTSEIVTKEKEVVISGVPKPPPHKLARLNTSEVSIKTASNTEPLVIPETKINDSAQTSQSKPKMGLEIFSLDSDDEDSSAKEKPGTSPHKMTALELEKARETSKCINYCCTNGNKVPYRVAEPSVVAYYDAGRKRRSMVCLPCADVVANRTKNLIQGIKDLTPLLDLEMDKLSQDLVEISDSESEDEDMTPEEPKESIGEEGAKFVEDNLAKFLNDTWKKYDMDARLKETQIMLDDEIEKLEQDSKEIDAMLNECQVATDKLRCDLYASFECRREELPPLVLYDTPDIKLVGLEMDQTTDTPATPIETTETRLAKRRLSSSSEVPAKRPAIPLGYTPLDPQTTPKDPKIAIPLPDGKLDDDKDISVVKLSAEAAPADLPPPGEISRPPLRVNMLVYAMKNAFGPWLRGRVLEIQPKNPNGGTPFSLCRVKFDHKRQANGKVLAARCIAYAEPADVRMTIGTRLIALFKDSNKRESYYSGVVAEIPNPVNNYRYLVFFDDGYAQYVQHQHTRLVCESSPLVWEEVHPFSREFVREYLLAYPERPMVRLHEGQHLKTEWNGKWWSSRVTKVDASLAQVMFVGDGRREWIYRGSTRLAPLYLELRAAERHRPRPMPRSKAQPRLNMPYVEYTRSDEQEASKQAEAQTQQQQQNEEIRRQRAVARKSTSAAPAPAPPAPAPALDTVTSRVVYYTPKNAVKPYKMTPHKCGPKCKRSDVLSLKELRTYNPLAKPLLSGWERQIVRFKGHKEVMYRAPCGRRLRSVRELHRYLRAVACDLPVDLFDFHPATHCLAEFVLNKCRVGKKDLSHGKENVPVPCVNYYDDSLPEFCSYNTERTPTAGVPLNLDPEFLCGCDCTDDCQDKSKCACWKMTLEGARTIGLEGPNVGYVYKRLPEPLPSGIYECNSRCKCKHTCLNRVAQHPLQLKLQVFKTLNRGWGIRALNDVPKGSFLCVYAGNLLTDATANLDGLNEGDEYLAELDYIEVVEQMKEGYEEDIPEADKRLDKKDQAKDGEGSEEDEPTSSEDEDTASKTDKEDDDFRPGHIGLGVMEFNKRLRKREKNKKDREKAAVDEKEKENSSKDKDSNSKESNADEDCITISDDEEVREPSRFMVQAGMGANEFISKYKSVRTLFGKDEACYIMDAKVQGNIGRYLNHSCCPNVFVQNVFVDTHDPRFPWVAFFALSHIKAGTELTWNYNYDVGSVPGKVLYCHCGAPNCRGRLL